jgi:hypothetical protein
MWLTIHPKNHMSGFRVYQAMGSSLGGKGKLAIT